MNTIIIVTDTLSLESKATNMHVSAEKYQVSKNIEGDSIVAFYQRITVTYENNLKHNCGNSILKHNCVIEREVSVATEIRLN